MSRGLIETKDMALSSWLNRDDFSLIKHEESEEMYETISFSYMHEVYSNRCEYAQLYTRIEMLCSYRGLIHRRLNMPAIILSADYKNKPKTYGYYLYGEHTGWG